jgi:SAM-dependent methyltransferase
MMNMPLSLNKVCDLRDFRDSEFLKVATWAFGLAETKGGSWPVGREDRKHWEVVMATMAVLRYLPIKRRVRALGVGAGTEATSFILTRLFQEVVATDLYEDEGTWCQDSPGDMLSNPARYAGSVPFDIDRLSVKHMNATALDCEDASCDYVYSSSAIEHFGPEEQIAKSAFEIGRVLRPGGIASLSTEYRIYGGSEWLDKYTYLFTKKAIEQLIIEPSGCERVDSPVWSVSVRTMLSLTSQQRAQEQARRMTNRLQFQWNKYPHVVLYGRGQAWTSLQITMRKPG